jgi:tetratricopeptide (TPR) repeat protein
MVLRLICLAALLPVLLSACVSSQNTPPRQESKTHYLLGVSALAENNPTMALQEFLLAEKEDSDDADIQAGLARAYLEKQAYPLAEKHLKRAISLSDDAPQHHHNLGALYLSMERYDDAITEFHKAAENLLFATPEVAWTGVGLAYFKKNDYPAAESYYLKARSLNPRYSQAYFRLGELYYSQDRSTDALDAFVRTVELNPRMIEGYYWLGLAAMKTQDNVRARKAFEEVIRLAPDSEQARLSKNHLKVLQ